MNKMIDFLFETLSLKRFPRLGYNLLGERGESVADHIYGSLVIGYVLAKLEKANVEKVLLMCLFHDLEETRTGDITKINLFYIKRDSVKAQRDLFKNLDLTKEPQAVLTEYGEKKSPEARIAHDANILDLTIELKRLAETGNIHAQEWFIANGTRLRTKSAQELYAKLKDANSQNWWKDLREAVTKIYRKE